MGSGPLQAETARRSSRAIIRCKHRLATTIPSGAQIPFLHFSPFPGNVETISIVHSSRFTNLCRLVEWTLNCAHCRYILQSTRSLLDWALKLFPLRASNEGHFSFSPTHPRGAETPHVPPGHALGEHRNDFGAQFRLSYCHPVTSYPFSCKQRLTKLV